MSAVAAPALAPSASRRRGGFAPSTGLVLAAPAVALMALLLIAPVVAALALSFTDYSLGGDAPGWVGLDNYEALFERRTYRKMFAATFGYVALVVPLSIGLGLAAALAIHSVGRFGELYKTIYFLPVMAALLAMAIVWEFTLHPTLGTVNRTLELACGTSMERFGFFADGCARGFPNWLGDRATALPVVAFIGVWQGVGFVMVLYLAGLTAVPRELLQAAEMDGAASAWERFGLVTWPSLAPTTVFVTTVTTVRAFQVFDTVEAFYAQSGGPSKSVYVMMFAIYEKGVKQNLVGVGSAITVLFLVLVAVLSAVQRRAVERGGASS